MAQPNFLLLLLCLFLFSHVLSFSSQASSSQPNAGKPLAFDFIKPLQGCQKGEKVEDIYKLKKYLKHFGYLNYHLNPNNTRANDDDFDDLLELAIKTYQVNYQLNPTGMLDTQTVSNMVQPRCGVPDISNGTNWMRRDKTGQLDQDAHIHTVSHFTFFPNRQSWPPSKTQLTYGFPANTPSEAIDAVARAFNTWASVTHFRFSRAQSYTSADLKISFERLNHGDGAPFDGPGGTIAHAFAPTDGRFHYDADESYTVGAKAGAYDLETVALHNIGHLLGLGHTNDQNAIMYPTISPGMTKGLGRDDIAGIKALYNTVPVARVSALVCSLI